MRDPLPIAYDMLLTGNTMISQRIGVDHVKVVKLRHDICEFCENRYTIVKQ